MCRTISWCSLPPGRYSHTCNAVDLTPFREKRVLIVGGRQSAFEWAALLLEQGRDRYISRTGTLHRRTRVADRTWVNAPVAAMVDDPGWFRGLPGSDREAVIQRMWGEGRLKVEPWLAPRLASDAVTISPHTRLIG